jgi:penicillin G amidase
MPDQEAARFSAGGSVKVEFGPDGWPTVRARNRTAAARGLGWCAGRQRRAQMDLLRRRSHGTLAAVTGRAALSGDITQRTLGLAITAERCLAGLPSAQRRLLSAFADGVNSAAGPGFDPWQPVDSIAVCQLLFQSLAPDGSDLRMVEVMQRTLPPEVVAFLLDGRDEFETGIDGVASHVPGRPVPRAAVKRLWDEPRPAAGAPVVAEQGPVGSNAWAAAADSGGAILVSDMHLELTHPSLGYAVRIVLPDNEVAGVTIPGLPLLVVGASRYVAWGFTRLPGDTVDLWEVGERDTPVELRRETIAVSDGDPVVITVRRTCRGPVVGELAGRRLVLDSTLADPAALDFGLERIYGARTVAEAAAIINESGLPPVNAVLADRSGNIGWTVGGRFRQRPETGSRGVSPAGRFAEPYPWIAAAALPRVLNPPSGQIVSCNNGNDALRESGVAWNFFCGTRARRTAEVLAAAAVRDEEAARDLQLDVDARFYELYRELALRHLPRSGRGQLSELREELESWRGTADRDEYGLAVLIVFRELLCEELFAALLGRCRRYDPGFAYCFHGLEAPLRGLIGRLGDDVLPAPWPSVRQLVLSLLLAARDVTRARAGHDGPVRWGEVNQLAPAVLGAGGHPAPVMELSGCPESVRVALPDFGAAARLVVNPLHRERGLLSVPGSADGSGPRQLVQLENWAAGLAMALWPDPALPAA